MESQNAVFQGEEFGADLDSTRQLISAFGDTYTTVVPSKKAILDSMESEQEAITEAVTQHKEQMATTEQGAEWYHNQLLLNQERQEKVPQLQRVERWLDLQDALFAGQFYGEDMATVSALLSSFESYTSAAGTNNAVRVAPLPNLAPNRLLMSCLLFPCCLLFQILTEMETNQEVIQSKLDELRTRIAATAEGAEYYHTQLLLSQERLEKLPQLEQISTWIATQQAVFDGGEYGATLAAVKQLLHSYDTFTTNAESHDKVRGRNALLHGDAGEAHVLLVCGG